MSCYLKIANIDTLYTIITEQCNSKCLACTYGENKSNKILPSQTLFHYVKAIKNRGLKNVMLSGGEALLHVDFEEIINELYSLGINIKVATNGINLNKISKDIISKIDLIVISLDAVNSETYQKVRGVDKFYNVKNNLQLLDKCKTRLSFLIQKSNYMELKDFITYAIEDKFQSVSILAPNFKRSFGPLGRDDYSDNIYLSKGDLKLFLKTQIPFLRKFLDKNPNFLNISNQKLDLYISYLTALADNKVFKKDEDKGEDKCFLPLNSILITPDPAYKLCFLFPQTHQLKFDDLLNDPNLQKERYEYYYRKKYDEICESCLQSYTIESKIL